MATHKPFRELVPPNSNFEFVGKIRTWVTISILLIGASIGMLFVNKSIRGDYLNWTIDFKGGTELILAFEKDGQPADIGSGEVRGALKDGGYSGFAVSNFTWDVTNEKTQEVRQASGMRVTTPDFGAVPEAKQEEIAAAFAERFKERGPRGEPPKATWSGDRVFARTIQPITEQEARAFFADFGLEMRKWDDVLTERFSTPEEGTGEYNAYFSIRGIDAQIEKVLEEKLQLEVEVVQTYAVGAKAGAQLRNDGIKSLFYAMALIMLYLAVRFDVRYAPGAVVALVHDALLVVGVFAATWQEVSLTTVAALLTVIGYSVNDSVVIFDRIRENVGRLKDKKFARVINISLNETMSRTLLTSITLFVVTLMMNIFGTGLVKNFAFAMNIGVVVGVYSSVFIASPVALFINNRWFAGSGPASKASGRKSSTKKKSTRPKKTTVERDEVTEPIEDDTSSDTDTATKPETRKKSGTKKKTGTKKTGTKKKAGTKKKTGTKKKKK